MKRKLGKELWIIRGNINSRLKLMSRRKNTKNAWIDIKMQKDKSKRIIG